MKGFVWLKKSVALTLTVVLVLCSTTVNVYGTSATITVTVDEPAKFNSAATVTATALEDDNLPSLKQVLRDGFVNMDEAIDVSDYDLFYTSGTDLIELNTLIFYQIPEAFHVDTYRYRYLASTGKIIQIVPVYLYAKEEYQVMYAECINAADKLLSGIKGNASLGEVEKALLLHDRVAEHCEYDYVNYEDETLPAVSFNMYGVLVNQTAVCEGYTDTYIYLLEQVGIKSDYCGSDTLEHAWNIVYIDGEAYHVDITWDDPVWDIGGRVLHNNFLLSTRALRSGVNGATPHYAYDYDSTPTDNRFDNYFWQDSEAAFQLIGNEIYYIDTEDEELKKYSNRSTIKDVDDRWYASKYAAWNDNFTRLASDGQKLYYSQRDAVYSFDVSTKKTEKIFEPDFDEFLEAIYGLTYENGYLICDIETSPNFDRYSKNKQIKYLLSAEIDADGNGTTSLSDVVAVSRYIAGWQTPQCTEKSLDVNGDKKVTLYDAVLLARYLAGWKVIIKK